MKGPSAPSCHGGLLGLSPAVYVVRGAAANSLGGGIDVAFYARTLTTPSPAVAGELLRAVFILRVIITNDEV